MKTEEISTEAGVVKSAVGGYRILPLGQMEVSSVEPVDVLPTGTVSNDALEDTTDLFFPTLGKFFLSILVGQ